MPADALNARAMNVRGRVSPQKLKVCKSVLHELFLADGGQQPKMRPGWYRRGGVRYKQHMVYQVLVPNKIQNKN